MADMHDVFMKTAFLIAQKSKCVSHHVGAVIVKNQRIVSIGYNGTPPGYKNCCEIFDEKSFDREEHYKWSRDNEIHAEMNAISFAAKNGESINGCDIYVTISPCNDCLKNMVMTGIKNVYYLYLYDKVEFNKEFLAHINIQEVPDAEEIKDFVRKNDLLYIPKK